MNNWPINAKELGARSRRVIYSDSIYMQFIRISHDAFIAAENKYEMWGFAGCFSYFSSSSDMHLDVE